MTKKTKLEIVLPPRASTDLDYGLVELTRVIHEKELADGSAGGLLGGEYGYGANFENDTFMMHRFCWCEQEDCPWCAGCSCPESTLHFFVDGQEVSSQEWMDFYDKETYQKLGAYSFKEWTSKNRTSKEHKQLATLGEVANKRRSTSHDSICDYCLGRGIFATSGSLPQRGAPNFWHKPTGFRVWWYKWIGRDMEIHQGSKVSWPDMLANCITTLSS